MKKILYLILFLVSIVSCVKDIVEPPIVYFDDFGINYDYSSTGYKWEKTNLIYKFGSSFPNNNEYKQSIRNAMGTWDDVIPLTFSESVNGEKEDITIEWGGINHVNCPKSFSENTLAHGCPPDFIEYNDFAGDLHFHNKWDWSTTGEKYDLETVALHEIGHVLGLAHSVNKSTVMYDSYQGVRHDLSQDDIDGIRSLYGGASIPVVQTNNITLITTISAISGGTVITDGGYPVSERGVCWNNVSNPTYLNNHTSDGSGNGGFSSSITGLIENTTYYVKAYAKNDAGIGYGNEMVFTTTSSSSGNISIGDIYQGGIVFYVDPTGQHGLISTIDNLNTADAMWGCMGTVIGTNEYDGSFNTGLIVDNCSEDGIAARLCSELNINGYNDWYLPSIYELYYMYYNLHVNGLGNFESGSYWSSSEDVDYPDEWATRLNFNTGISAPRHKDNTAFIRPIRKF